MPWWYGLERSQAEAKAARLRNTRQRRLGAALRGASVEPRASGSASSMGSESRADCHSSVMLEVESVESWRCSGLRS